MGATEPGAAGVSYAIDGTDRIVDVGDGWGSFARCNAGEAISERQVVGRSLWDFVGGAETRHVYQLLVRRVRQRGQPVRVSMRCDAPDVERALSIELAPLPGLGVRFTTRIERERARPAIALLDAAAPRTGELLAICCFCHDLRLSAPGPDEDWRRLEEGVEALGLLDRGPFPKLTHGICPDCFGRYFERDSPAA